MTPFLILTTKTKINADFRFCGLLFFAYRTTKTKIWSSNFCGTPPTTKIKLNFCARTTITKIKIKKQKWKGVSTQKYFTSVSIFLPILIFVFAVSCPISAKKRKNTKTKIVIFVFVFCGSYKERRKQNNFPYLLKMIVNFYLNNSVMVNLERINESTKCGTK